MLKKRPLRRDVGSLRDDRLFIIACDDTYAPKQYFDFFRLTRVQIHVVPTVDGTSAAAHVLTRLLSFDHHDDDERWLVLDVDHALNGGHVASFMEALKRAKDNCRARLREPVAAASAAQPQSARIVRRLAQEPGGTALADHVHFEGHGLARHRPLDIGERQTLPDVVPIGA